MDARVRRWMAASGAPIGHTTPAQRDAMPEDDLHRRNVEIAARQQQLDEVMLDDDADFDAIDDEMDDLLAESDEIEALLEDRFRVVGGGRLWLQPAIAEASAIARQLAPPPPDALVRPATFRCGGIDSSDTCCCSRSRQAAGRPWRQRGRLASRRLWRLDRHRQCMHPAC